MAITEVPSSDHQCRGHKEDIFTLSLMSWFEKQMLFSLEQCKIENRGGGGCKTGRCQ